MPTSWRCPRGVSDSWEAPKQKRQMVFWGSFRTQGGEEERLSAVPPGPGWTSTAPCSFGPPCGRSGRPGSAVPALQPGPSPRWATQLQCTGQSYRHRAPLSPAAPALGRTLSGRPGSASACPGPIPGSRNGGPGAGWCCIRMQPHSFAPGVLTSRRQGSALNFTSHATSTCFRKGSGWCVTDRGSTWVSQVWLCSGFVALGELYGWISVLQLLMSHIDKRVIL